MTRIVMDAALREKLNGLNQIVELCDDSGHVVARVVPTTMQVRPEDLIPPIDEEEIERRRNSTAPGYTTAEVLRHLESL